MSLPRIIAICGCAAVSASQGFADDWVRERGFSYRDLPSSGFARPGFTLVSPAYSGVAFTNVLGEERSLTNQIYHNGSGVALGDVDGDGRCDAYFGNLDGSNRLYQNLGNWKFADITGESGVACDDFDTTGVLFGDLDGDGDSDLLVNAIGQGTSVFTNDGRGRFTNITKTAGTGARTGSTSMALADVDGDGDLDLYVTNYRTASLRDEPFTKFTVNIVNGKPTVTAVNGRSTKAPELLGRFTVNEQGAILEHGEPDVLFRNEGAGRFSSFSWTNGAFLDEEGGRFSTPYEFGLSVMMRDLNGDSAPDIYVCNDFEGPDRIWINQGHGTFRLISKLALRQTSVFSMGVDVADIDRDGYDDIFVVDMLSREHVRRMVQLGDRKPAFSMPGLFANRPQYMRNTLFWNRGDNTYAEVAQIAGLDASEWSWTPIFVDVDLDGYEDLLISNGHLRDAQNVDYARRVEALKNERRMSAVEQLRLRKIYPRLDNQNLAYRNLGNLRFEDVSAAWGFAATGAKQGMALADLDNDGDLDVAVNPLNGPALLYRNDTTAPRVQVRLNGKSPNTRGVGAKIRVLGGPVVQSQEMICGGRFLSGDDFVRVFAAGSATDNMTIEVTWRSGLRSVVSGARANRIYEIDEEAGSVPKLETPTPPMQSWFKDVSAQLAHAHYDEDFNDFDRQPLLVRKLSQAGPGVTWFDVDGDGFDDLILGSGRGGELAVYHSDGKGGFKMVKTPLNARTSRDQTAVLGVQIDERRLLLLGQSHYEDGQTNGGAVLQHSVPPGNIVEAVPISESSLGPLALGAIDKDGALKLFVGGRVIPGRYPEAASSRLYRSGAQGWVLDVENSRALSEIGLVTSAVFSDLSGDGSPDLVLASEWGPLRIFRNEQGILKPWNPSVTSDVSATQATNLNQFTGWWNSVAAGDFNGDGRMDLVAGNWGENTSYQKYDQRPIHVYYGDFDDNGTFDLLEACYDRGVKKRVPLRDASAVARALPYLASRFSSYEQYGNAGIAEVIDRKPEVKELAITTLRSMIFLNRGTNFEALPLPLEAQLSPVFGIAVADFDGDGHEDLIFAQNFFAVEPMTSRYDAGRGLLLRGAGDGTFRAIAGQESGLAVYGEGRGAAVCDFDGDGRVDVCIGQNGAQTKLYRNERAKPGLRVRLQGPASNPMAIGALLWPVFADAKKGAAREIHAGTGWLSQDGRVQVIASPRPIISVAVKWPGGKTTQSIIPPQAEAVSIDWSGNLSVTR